jgi:alkylation response protein AidB-like acyl-CoA dehydrogenase
MTTPASRPGAFDRPADYAAALARAVDEDDRLAAYRGYRAPNLEAASEHLKGLQRVLDEDGWSRQGWPETIGGLGGDPVLRAAMFETLTAADIPLPDSFMTLEVLVPVLVAHAPHLAERYFRPLLRGEELWCQGFSEPDAGSDLASLRTRMEPDGDGWRVTGQKVWSSFGHLAQRSVLLARSGGPGHRGLTMVLLDLDQPGVDVRPIRCEDGEQHLAEIFLDGARMEGDRVIGELGTGWAMAMYMLQWERGAWGWQQQGKFHRRLEAALAEAPVAGPPLFAASRAGADRAEAPLGGSDDAGDPTTLGRAYLAMAALRVRARDTVRRLAREEQLGAETSIDKLLLARAEVAAFDAVRRHLRPRLELGDGVDDDWWRAEFLYSRAAPIYGGSQDIQRTLVAQRLLGLPREP